MDWVTWVLVGGVIGMLFPVVRQWGWQAGWKERGELDADYICYAHPKYCGCDKVRRGK
jgi:hypothetical protein